MRLRLFKQMLSEGYLELAFLGTFKVLEHIYICQDVHQGRRPRIQFQIIICFVTAAEVP